MLILWHLPLLYRYYHNDSQNVQIVEFQAIKLLNVLN